MCTQLRAKFVCVGSGVALGVAFCSLATSKLPNELVSIFSSTKLTYDPWGKVLGGGTQSKFLYTGQEKDTETNLNYYNARYYSADTRRFTQPDDIIQDIYNPQTLNRYSYVSNNPLRYTDPTGHCFGPFTPFCQQIISTTTKILQTVVNLSTKAGNNPVVQKLIQNTNKSQSNPIVQKVENVSSAIDTNTLNTNAVARGAQIPAVRNSIRLGIQNHAAFYQKMDGPGVITNKAVFRFSEPGNLLRPDAIDFTNKLVHELKPEWSTSAEQQLLQYVNTANRLFGPGWVGIPHTYK